MRSPAVFGAALLAATAAVADADAERFDVVVPGRLIDFAIADSGRPETEIVLLIEPMAFPEDPVEADAPESEEDPEESEAKRLPPCPDETEVESGGDNASTQLYSLRPSGDGGLALILDDLPGNFRSIDAVDVDGNGRDELLLERKGELVLVERGAGPGAAANVPVTVLTDPGLVWSGFALAAGMRLGSLRLYGPADEGAHWRPLAEVELPIGGALRGHRLRVATEVPSFVGLGAGETLTFATSPRAQFGRRLQVQLIEVAPGGEATVTDCWAGLPEPEDLLESFFMMADGRPSLLVTTKEAGKLGLFSEKFLRLYDLERDRSRLGIAPRMAVQSQMNLWQAAHPILRDVNADGRDDLVVGYWKGITDDKVVLDVYVRAEDGTFASSPRTTAFNVKDAARGWLHYGSDLDADGRPDLLLRDNKNNLLLHAGLPSPKGKRLVAGKPRRIPLGETEWASEEVVVSLGTSGVDARTDGSWGGASLRVVDVEGDGREEIVLVQSGDEKEPGILRIVRP